MAASRSGGATPSAQAKADKVRSLLASYYDDEGAEEASTSSPVAWALPPKAPSPGAGRVESAALNTTYFDPDAYLRRMLKETRLGDLADKASRAPGRARAVMSEVGSLDSDMQQLVYENYSKFITATDTIKAMSGSMEGMDERMQSLKTLIDDVVERSNAVNGKLQQRQDRIEELNAVRLLLRKLQGVFELPRKLRAAVDASAYDVAVDAYAEVVPLLQAYGHKGAFKKVTSEVAACVEELTSILRQQLIARPDTAAECVARLSKLGAPIEPLQDAYLECKRQRMEAILAACGLMLKRLAVRSGLLVPGAEGVADPALLQKMETLFPGATGQLPTLKQVIITLNSAFMTELTQTAGLFGQLFEAGGRQRLVRACREVLARYLKLVRRALSDAGATAAAAAAGITTSGAPAAPLAPLLGPAGPAPGGGAEWGPGGARRAAVEASVGTDWGVGGLLEGLYVVRNDLGRLHGLLPELSPRDKGHEVVTNAVRQHAALCFAALERRLLGTVDALCAALGSAPRGDERRPHLAQAGLAILQAVLAAGTERLLVSVKEYERQKWVLQGWQDEFVNAVHGQMQNLFLSLSQQLLAAAQLTDGSSPGSAPAAVAAAAAPCTAVSAVPFAAPVQRRPTPEQPGTPGGGGGPPPVLLLLLSKFCSHAEQEAVASGLVLMQHLFPAPSSGDQPPAFLPTDLARKLGAAAAALLRGYVDRAGQMLALAARQSTAATDWVNHREPRAPRPFCDLLLEKLAEVDAEVAFLSDEARPGSSAYGHSRMPSTSSAASWEGGRAASELPGPGGFMEASLSRMLAAGPARGGVSEDGTPEFSRAGVVTAVLALALQKLVDSLHQQTTIGRAGLQQLQLDVHYLRPAVQRYAAGSLEGAETAQLLDELMAAGAERCTQPLLLDPTVLDRILAAAAAQKQAAQPAGHCKSRQMGQRQSKSEARLESSPSEAAQRLASGAAQGGAVPGEGSVPESVRVMLRSRADGTVEVAFEVVLDEDDLVIRVALMESFSPDKPCHVVFLPSSRQAADALPHRLDNWLTAEDEHEEGFAPTPGKAAAAMLQEAASSASSVLAKLTPRRASAIPTWKIGTAAGADLQ
eukprot:scaffold2.g7202.t1